MWRKLSKDHSGDMKDIYLRFAIQAISSLMIAAALYIAIITFQKTQITYAHETFTKLFSWFLQDNKSETTELIAAMKTAAFIWFGFIFSTKLSCFAWTQPMNITKFMIGTGCKLIQFLAIAAIFTILV